MPKPKVFAIRPALQISRKHTSRAATDAAVSFGGANTADVLTEVSRCLEKHLWFLGALVKIFFGRDREHWRPATAKRIRGWQVMSSHAWVDAF